MSFGARREYFREIWQRYQTGSKKQKTAILDEYCKVCGFSRKYAIRLLNQGIKDRKKKSGPKEIYDQVFVEVLFDLWQLMQGMCGKKMKVAIPEWLPFYAHEKCTKEIEKKLKKISASHIDRLLAPLKKPKGRCTTKAGKFLKTNIPIETRHDGAKQPGFVQGDTVAHCGDHIDGTYAHSLTVTDISSNWTENRATLGKSEDVVLAAYREIEGALPFDAIGWSSDNGSEFLNHKMWNYLNSRGMKITRGRPSHKNDNPHVEQKNFTHVRKLFGYQRFEHRSLVSAMNAIYENYWNPLHNFFTPSQKLIKKERIGSKIVKKYDKPQTPYQRLLKSDKLSNEKKAALKRKYESLNPIYLAQKLAEERAAFFKMVQEKRRSDPD